MNTNTATSALEKVRTIASMAGVPLRWQDENQHCLACHCDMGNGRTQMIFIFHMGATPEGQDIVAFSSPCVQLQDDGRGGWISINPADLLRMNSQLVWGSFAVETAGDKQYLVVRDTQIVDTMEVEEFRAHLGLVSRIADDYESRFGVDIF
jgi:hypothetical protein